MNLIQRKYTGSYVYEERGGFGGLVSVAKVYQVKSNYVTKFCK